MGGRGVAADGAPSAHRRGPPAALRQDEGDLEEAEPAAAGRLGQADADEPGIGELLPQIAVDRAGVVVLDVLEVIVGAPRGQDLTGEVAQRL